MRCPNCDRWVSEDRFLSACDCGEQDYEGGGRRRRQRQRVNATPLLPAFVRAPEQNRIYRCTDLELINALDDGSVGAFIADPPYGLASKPVYIARPDTGGAYNRIKEEWDYIVPLEWMSICERKLKRGGSVIVFGAWENIHVVRQEGLRLGWRLVNRVVWHKTDPAPNFTGRMMTFSTEEFLWFCPDGSNWTYNIDVAKELNNGANLHDVWEIGQTREERVHPAQKPQPLMDQIIRLFTQEGDLVVDPFAGSGTTLLSARNWKRRYLGCDSGKDKKTGAHWADIATDRLRLPHEAKRSVADNDVSGLPLFAGVA